jgi:hypothetical protein
VRWSAIVTLGAMWVVACGTSPPPPDLMEAGPDATRDGGDATLDPTIDLDADRIEVDSRATGELTADGADMADEVAPDLLADLAETTDLWVCDPDPAGEVCDGLDNDCDGLVDEDLGVQECGLGNCFHQVPNCIAGKATSCNPLAGVKAEACNGFDDDCDGLVDEDFPDLDGDGLAACQDNDDDGDQVPDVVDNCPGRKNPLQTDTDNDGDGDLCDDDDDDDGVPDLEDLCPLNFDPDQEDFDLDGTGDACDADTDGDVDDDGIPNAQDCAPLDSAIYPGQTESCNLVDDNCDEVVDEAGAAGCQTWYLDIDGDGAGILEDSLCLCSPETPYSAAAAGDCSPFDDLTAPGFPEYCDGLDNDCDGGVDEGLGSVICGQGICQHVIPFCTDGELTPCDALAGATDETCDGLDNDCDGSVDEGC